MGQHMVEQIELKSPVFRHQGNIPEKYTCDGDNLSPPLQFAFPSQPEMQSLALIMDDPDAPRGVYTHWLMWNIDANTTEIGENSVPVTAVQGMNSSGTLGYTGPCPPMGEHRYYFKLFALDTTLALPEDASKQELERAMEGHVIGQAVLMGRYARNDQRQSKARKPQ